MIASSRAARLAVAVLVLALPLAACKEEKKAESGEQIRPVRVMTVSAGSETRTLTYSGSVRARVETALGFRVPGKMVERLVNVGDKVTVGTVLARLDRTDLELQLRTADANVAAARARVKVADDGRARAQALNKKGFLADSGLDRADLEADQARAALEAAVYARDQAANQIAYAALEADGDGIVTDIRADVGQVVAAGTPVVTLARDGEKEVAIAVPEQDVTRFARDQVVALRFFADRDLALSGRIREIAGSADPASRTYAIRVSVDDDARVRLGMTATVEATVPVAEGTIVVPVAALSGAPDRPRVWVVDVATATVQPREVELGAVAPDGVRIRSGLAAGDVIVTAGTQFLVPGRKVHLPDAAPRAAATR